VKVTQMEAFTKSVQSSTDHCFSSKGADTSITEKKKEKRVRLLSPTRESWTDRKINALEEVIEKQRPRA